MENNKYWSDIIGKLNPYIPGEQPKNLNLLKLNTNENPYPPSPKVRDAIISELDGQLRLYPDPNAEILKKAVADTLNVETEQVFVGNGSDEVLAHIFHAFFKQQTPILFPDVTYSFYRAYCGLYQVPYELVPLTEDLSISISDYQKPNGGIIFPNPNAPTGRLLSLPAIETLLKGNKDSVVVVDEAYIDFSSQKSLINLIGKYENLIITQTMSKAYGMAGIRLGMGFSNEKIISYINKIKPPYNINILTKNKALEELKKVSEIKSNVNSILNQREKLIFFLEKLDFVEKIYESDANFILVKVDNADLRYNQLLKKGIVVRNRTNQYLCQNCLRITVGTKDENKILIKTLNEL